MKTSVWIQLLLSLGMSTSKANKETNERLTAALKNLKWTNLTMIHFGSANEKAALMRSASKSMIQADVQSNHSPDFDRVCIFGDKVEHLNVLGNILRMRKPADSVMVALEETGMLLLTFNDQFRQFNESRSFYRFTNSQLFHHTSFRDQDVLLEHKIDCNSKKCSLDLKNFSYGNATIIQKAKTWHPWLSIGNCKEINRFCSSSGILHDIMDIIARSHNFTWDLQMSQDVWGGFPKSNNWSDPNRIFEGIFNMIVHDEIDIALSIWDNVPERHPFADITAPVYSRKIEVYVNSKSDVLDRQLLTKPFTLSSWCGIAFLTVLIITIDKLAPKFLVFWRDCWYTRRIIILTGWVFFNMINAYYGGALTMFFSIPPTYPFSNVIEGLDLYPDWKMLALHPFDINVLFFKAKDLKQTQTLSFYKNLINTEEGKHLASGKISGTLRMLQEPGHFLMLTDPVRFSRVFFESQNSKKLNLHLVGRDASIRSGIALPKYSVHTKIFNFGK